MRRILGNVLNCEPPYGMTLQIQVGDVEEARQFYSAIFGTKPLFEPHDDFLEWPVVQGTEIWIQAVGVKGEVRPLMNRIRFAVRDLAAMHARLTENGFELSRMTELPGVVAFFDFADPWGNQLGYYEDISASGEQPVVGGSVHDESLFVTK